MDRKFICLALLVLVAVGTCVGQTEPASAELKQKTFEKVWSIINEKFYDPNFNGVDWKAMREKYSPQASAAKTDDEFYSVLNSMVSELKVSHVGIIPPEEIAKMSMPATITGLGLRDVDGQVVISRILQGSSAEIAKLRMGFVIKKIGDTEIRKVEEALPLLAGAPGTSVKIAYADDSDIVKEVELQRNPLSDDDRGNLTKGVKVYALFESKRLDANIGYIRFSNFVKFLTRRILEAIDSMKDASGLIIDLRGNSGGDDGVSLKMANKLFDKETQLMIIKTRNSVNRSYKADPAKDAYHGPVAILVDEFSASASEEFAAALQDTRRAFIVGKTTMGQDLDADFVKLPSGAYLLYPFGQPRTPSGVLIEGRGVIPDKDVSLTRSGLLAGHDAQLEAAIEYIRSKAQK